MVCKNCPPGTGRGLRIYDVKWDLKVRPGDMYHIYVNVENRSMLVGDWGRVCLWEQMELVTQSGSFYSVKDELYTIHFTGIMPDRDLYLNVSLVDEQIYKLTTCVDGKTILIRKSDITEHVDPTPPVPPKPEGEGEGEGEDILQWMMDNLIWILLLILIIIIMLKFG